jgi:hypothetical protein
LILALRIALKSGSGGGADVACQGLSGPFIAKKRHCSHKRRASPNEKDARQNRQFQARSSGLPLLTLRICGSQGGPSPLPSSNDRTSRHPRYIIRRLTIKPPINPAQSIVRSCFNPLYSIPACQYTLPLMMCALCFRCLSPIYFRYRGQSRHRKSAFRDRCNFSPVMSAFGGKADLRGAAPKSPLIARSGHSGIPVRASE